MLPQQRVTDALLLCREKGATTLTNGEGGHDKQDIDP